MRIARGRLALVAALLVAGCVVPPMLQRTIPFERHPGVVMEVWSDYAGYTTTTLVNRGSVAKCAWTNTLDSRLLRPGESLPLGYVSSPVNVVVANVAPSDPNCVAAKSGQPAPPR
jgi:hypothetical protein